MVYGATIIDGPVPNKDDLEWNSDDLDGDSIPSRYTNNDFLWWSIIIEENPSEELYNEIFNWCEENCEYQCALRYEPDSMTNGSGFPQNPMNDGYIIGYFRHPDDALNFKWSWI